jgi:hypothetical protein
VKGDSFLNSRSS